MIFKKTIMFISILGCVSLGYGQAIPKMKVQDGVFFDVDNRPLFKFLSDDWTLAYWYSPINNVASSNIEFENGEEALTNFVDSVYYYHWTTEYGEREINSWTRYVILFDSDLKIKSVYIVLSAYAKKEWGFDELLRKMVYATEGRWRKKSPHERFKYYYWLGSFHFI